MSPTGSMDALNDAIGHVDEDIVVQTTIDANLQAVAEKALDGRARAERRQERRRPGRGDRDDAGWHGARAGRRPQLRRQPVQPRGRGQTPARIGLQAVRLSHRARARPHARHGARGQADQRQRLAAGKLQPRIFRPGDADPGAGAIAQYGVGAADARGHADGRDPHGLSARHRLEARAECVDRARHLGSLDARTGRRLCVASPMAATR